jgi:transcription elongation factor Elf1
VTRHQLHGVVDASIEKSNSQNLDGVAHGMRLKVKVQNGRMRIDAGCWMLDAGSEHEHEHEHEHDYEQEQEQEHE